MFLAAIRLRYSHPEVIRAYQIPGGKIGIWLIGLAGACSAIFTISIGFLPPEQIRFSQNHIYGIILASSLILFCLPPLFITPKIKKN